ncbi:helix-turn-helix domain-containing protein [Acidicapsa acidisoli]|uniref:helix-turn-helix domain-containing protein n=1 Tax=Acidicapsa acidisoli TaxID=1615681 RepID=UPI0021DF76E5|nr:helix-turn-helix domain-containing protein [Acidicapsa acidisoli]
MRNTTRPRHTAAPSTAQAPNKATSFSGNPQAEAPEMFNILLALESARGLLSVRDVARLLGKSIFTVYRLAEQRKIPSLVIGGSRCFDPSVLALWLSKKEPSLATAARRFKTA